MKDSAFIDGHNENADQSQRALSPMRLPQIAKKKIVIVSGFRIFPMNTGGHVHTGSIALALGRMGHDVLIYSLAGRGGDYFRSGIRGLGQSKSFSTNRIGQNVVEETHLGLSFGITQAIARRLGLPRVLQHEMLHRGIIPGRLKTTLMSADIIICDMPWCPPIPGAWSQKPCFLISHNLEYRLLEQGTARHRLFAKWMKSIEAEVPQQYDDVFACADEDLEFFRRHDMARRLSIPMIRCGVDPAAYTVPGGTRERTRRELGLTDDDRLLVFSASGHGPNVEAYEALQAFCRNEQEFLQRERIYILALGSVAPQPMQSGSLIATGRVPEVAPYFAAADAGLNIVTRGSGANVKLFEYLATGLPVISTVFGIRGTELRPDEDFLPCDANDLKPALLRYAHERSQNEWRLFAEQVWKRHRSSCDINELVGTAVSHLPAFGA